MKNTEQLKKTDLLSEILEETKASLNPLKAEVETSEPTYKELNEKAKNLHDRYVAVFWERFTKSSPRPFIVPSYGWEYDCICVHKKDWWAYELYPKGRKLIVYKNEGWLFSSKGESSSLSVEDYKTVLRKIDEALTEEEKIVRAKEKSNINSL